MIDRLGRYNRTSRPALRRLSWSVQHVVSLGVAGVEEVSLFYTGTLPHHYSGRAIALSLSLSLSLTLFSDVSVCVAH